MDAENRPVTLNEAKILWIEARLTAANEALEEIEERLPREVRGRGRPSERTLRRVCAIARMLEVLSGELRELTDDMRRGAGRRPVLRSEFYAWMGCKP
jgi:hypothetical protein